MPYLRRNSSNSIGRNLLESGSLKPKGGEKCQNFVYIKSVLFTVRTKPFIFETRIKFSESLVLKFCVKKLFNNCFYIVFALQILKHYYFKARVIEMKTFPNALSDTQQDHKPGSKYRNLKFPPLVAQ